MTIAQRIELRRLGYTKEEIAELVELEKAPQPEAPPEPETVPEPETAPEPEAPPEPKATQPTNDINAQLLVAINNLTTVLQNQKLNQTAQPEVKPETVDDIFNNILKG